MKITIKCYIFELAYVLNFQLNLVILFIWTKFAQKEYYWSQTKKVNMTIEFCIFELV